MFDYLRVTSSHSIVLRMNNNFCHNKNFLFLMLYKLMIYFFMYIYLKYALELIYDFFAKINMV